MLLPSPVSFRNPSEIPQAFNHQTLHLGVDTLENSFSLVETMRNPNCHSICSSNLHGGRLSYSRWLSRDHFCADVPSEESSEMSGSFTSNCLLLKRTLKRLFQVPSASALITLSAGSVCLVLPFARGEWFVSACSEK